MKCPIIDAHIHLDKYSKQDQDSLLQELDDDQVEALVAVSCDLESAKTNLALSHVDRRIKPAIGYHPEQSLPSAATMNSLHSLLWHYQDEIVAIGEAGLPYYSRKKDSSIPLEPYIELLEQFIQLAGKLNKPIALHAVYDDAPIVCDLLEKHSVTNAHFHWFKGDAKTIDRMLQNGYYISITPDVLYEKEIQKLVEAYPLANMMVETDGPWSFKGPFQGKQTRPNMIHESIPKIAAIKKTDSKTVYQQVLNNTKRFYHI